MSVIRMSNETENDKLLRLGQDLSAQLYSWTAEQDGDALLQARRQALRSLAQVDQTPVRRRGWMPAAVVVGMTALLIVMVTPLWYKDASMNQQGEIQVALQTNNLLDSDAPWHEDLDMLQDIDFTLWLDMTGLEDAS